MATTLLQGRGIRQVTAGLGSLDSAVFEAVAESPTPRIIAALLLGRYRVLALYRS